jgi:hypothetical protein
MINTSIREAQISKRCQMYWQYFVILLRFSSFNSSLIKASLFPAFTQVFMFQVKFGLPRLRWRISEVIVERFSVHFCQFWSIHGTPRSKSTEMSISLIRFPLPRKILYIINQFHFVICDNFSTSSSTGNFCQNFVSFSFFYLFLE